MIAALLSAFLLPPAVPPMTPPLKPLPKPPAIAAVPQDPTTADKPSVTQHHILLNGKPLAYTATAGMISISDGAGEVHGRVFYVAYTRKPAPGGAPRPLVFMWNGGPGSPAIWLHMGCAGPRRAALKSNGEMPPPPFHAVDNQETWLDAADLVFMDPVGTGYSHSEKREFDATFYGIFEDASATGEFIRMYLSRNDRWGSPLFLAGESYGTTRAALLSQTLQDSGIALNGVILISSILDFSVGEFAGGTDLTYIVSLPTFAACAWYHHKLAPDLEKKPLDVFLREVDNWAGGEYATALLQGDRLPADKREAMVSQYARYTGLSRVFVDDANMRVTSTRFKKELLRNKHVDLGAYDGRLLGPDADSAGEVPTIDPSTANMEPPITMVFNQYVREDLGFKSDRNYETNANLWGRWDWNGGSPSDTIVTDNLSNAMAKNRHLKVFVARGDYDMVTPRYAADYTLAHAGFDPSFQSRISMGEYPAGHMLYIDTPSRQKLKRDVTAFIKSALTP